MYTLKERIFHKVKVNTQKIRALFLRKKLIRKDFSIISNNCWGGVCYENFNLPKKSPTIGGYFFAEDYIKFVSNLRYYLSLEIKMITVKDSKHKEEIVAFGKENEMAPIGVIDDVEFVFLHYKNSEIAKEKWMRRVKRVNWDNLVFKFSNQNSCTENQLEEFDKLNLPGKKIMFVNKPDTKYECGVYYPGFENEKYVLNDTFYWNRYFDVYAFLTGEGIITKNI